MLSYIIVIFKIGSPTTILYFELHSHILSIFSIFIESVSIPFPTNL